MLCVPIVYMPLTTFDYDADTWIFVNNRHGYLLMESFAFQRSSSSPCEHGIDKLIVLSEIK